MCNLDRSLVYVCGITGLVSLVGAATSIIFAVTKHIFCRDKSMLVITKCLSGQIYFVATNICHDKHNFVEKIVLSWQAYFCCDNTCLSQQIFVTTKVLSRQTHLCDKHNFVTTKVLL